MPFVRFLAPLIVLMLVVFAGANPVFAAARTALIIGNAAYPDSEAVLPSPVPDAHALSDALKRSGFTVELGENLSKDAMQKVIERYQRGVEPDGIALVFFSGYGIQVAKRNYLVPIDARIWSEADVTRDGIAVDDILDGLGKRGPSARVLILDASRRNPFERRFRSFSMGLAPVATAPGLLAISATAAGGVLNEGGATRSPFVAELIRQIGVVDQDAEQAFAAVRETLSKRARSGPAPAVVSQLDEPFSFDPDRPRPRRPVDAPAAADKGLPGRASKDQAAADEAARKAASDRLAREEADRTAARQESARQESARQESARQESVRQESARQERARQDQARQDQVRQDQVRQEQIRNDRLAAEERSARDQAAARERAEADALAGARSKGTKAAYEDFLRAYPDGAHAGTARTEMAGLGAERSDDPNHQRLADLDTRIAKDPRDALAYYERGQFNAQRGDNAAAIADFDQTIRLNPLNPEAYNNRCWMRAMIDALKAALSDCNQALKLRPGFADALDSRGLVNLKSGAFRAAVSDYDAVLRLDPGRSSALYGRGLARKGLGETALGQRDRASALQLNPSLDKEFSEYGLR